MEKRQITCPFIAKIHADLPHSEQTCVRVSLTRLVSLVVDHGISRVYAVILCLAVIWSQGNLWSMEWYRLNRCTFGISSTAHFGTNLHATEVTIRNRRGADGRLSLLDLVTIRRDIAEYSQSPLNFAQYTEVISVFSIAGGEMSSMTVDAENVINVLRSDFVKPQDVRLSLVGTLLCLGYLAWTALQTSMVVQFFSLYIWCAPTSEVTALLKTYLLYIPLRTKYAVHVYAQHVTNGMTNNEAVPMFETQVQQSADVDEIANSLESMKIPKNPYFNANLPMYARFFVHTRFASFSIDTPGIWNVLYGITRPGGPRDDSLFIRGGYKLDIDRQNTRHNKSSDLTMWIQVFQKYHNRLYDKVCGDFPQKQPSDVFDIVRVILWWSFHISSAEYIATFSGPFYWTLRDLLETKTTAELTDWVKFPGPQRQGTDRPDTHYKISVPEVSIWYWNHGWMSEAVFLDDGNPVSYESLVKPTTVRTTDERIGDENWETVSLVPSSVLVANMQNPAGMARNVTTWTKPILKAKFGVCRHWKIGTVDEFRQQLGLCPLSGFEAWPTEVRSRLENIYATSADVEFPWAVMFGPGNLEHMDLGYVAGAFGLLTGIDDENRTRSEARSMFPFCDMDLKNYIRTNVTHTLVEIIEPNNPGVICSPESSVFVLKGRSKVYDRATPWWSSIITPLLARGLDLTRSMHIPTWIETL